MGSIVVGLVLAGALVSTLMTIGDIVEGKSDYPVGALVAGGFLWLAVVLAGGLV